MIRGWCPTVHAPMPTGDGLLARVKPFGGRLPASALRALAEAAADYGNGAVELTGRGNIQVRGLHDPAAFARAIVRAGLADPDPLREARRNVVAVPPCDDALVAAVEAMLAETSGLPEKFFVVVQGERIWVGREAVGGLSGLRDTLTYLLYLPFGQTTAAALADLASQTPELRTTPWRAFLSSVPVRGFAAKPGTVIACAGAPACASATTPTRADAARLQASGATRLHVSGCAKGCAHPHAATTLVGREGRYDLVRHGRASDAPALTGLTLEQAAAAL